MEMQLDFFRGRAAVDEARALEHRYYFTLVPPPALAQKMERGARMLALRHGARKVVRAERQHVSLHIVEKGREIAGDLLDDALEIGNAIRRPGFEMAFDMVRTFGAKRSRGGVSAQYPIVLTCSNGARDAKALYADIRQQMQRFGLSVGPRSIEPHLTIWYGPGKVPDLILRRPFRWPVRSFWLVHTLPGMRRPEYLAEWPLSR